MTRGRYPRRLRVKPPPPALATQYLCRWDARQLYENPGQFPELTAGAMFVKKGPLEIEVGCGTGEFLCGLAVRQPENLFIGVDIALKPLFRAVEIAASFALTNIRFVKANIKQLYPLMPPASLQNIYLHFPVPPAKSRVWRHQIFERAFLDQAHVSLIGGGRISVMTDQPKTFRDMLAIATEDKRFRLILEGPFALNLDESLKSHNQVVWEKRGHRVLRFEMEKMET